MGANAKRRREAKETERMETAKALAKGYGRLPAADSQVCFCGGFRHPHGQRPPVYPYAGDEQSKLKPVYPRCPAKK